MILLYLTEEVNFPCIMKFERVKKKMISHNNECIRLNVATSSVAK